MIRAARKGAKQPKPTCLFRGVGKRISQLEKARRVPRVQVRFQRKAWADRDFTNKWLDEVLLNKIREVSERDEESLFFL